MNDPTKDLFTSYKEIIAQIQRRLTSKKAPVVVALDGGSGAGKSSVASIIEDEICTAVIPLDDFFSADIPDNEWDEFIVEEKLNHVFDWARLRDQVIVPLLEGKPAKWHAFDFSSGLRADGTYAMENDVKQREPADVILLEGAYSASSKIADLVDLAILMDVPDKERHTRLESREDQEFLIKWHKRWDEVEEFYFTLVRPKNSFDLIVRPE